MQPFDSILPRTGATRRRVAAATLGCAAAAALFSAVAAPSFVPENSPTGWVTQPALTSNDLRTGTEVIYRGDYKLGLWTGRVTANHVNAAGTILETTPWNLGDTAQVLESTDWNVGRRIVTRNGAGTGVPFRWASIDPAQQAMLGSATTGPKVLNYVRGDRSNEAPNGDKFRARDKIQGGIQHSTLLYWAHAGGVRRLYVGGNDGMLHAFDAATGTETFAYVPSMLISRLPRLVTDPYLATTYVDGGLTMAEVTLAAGVRTLLVGGLGGGARGLFMLDLTNPSPATEAAAAAMVKWEITSASVGYSNLGFTYARPRMARLNSDSPAVVVGNGYLNTGTGRATLFLINADTGALIREIDTGVGTLASPNGLSTPTLLDTDSDGKVDYAYAGDVDGNLWRFDLRGNNPAAYSVTKLLTTSPAQSITSAPVVARHPLGGYMVEFGTGRTLSSADVADASVHYVYGLWDAAPAANVSWLDQTISEVSLGAQRMRHVTSNAPNWASGGHRGWRLALPAGERVLGDGQFLNDGRLYFTSTNPTKPATTVGGAKGENWIMEVGYLNGGSPASPIFDANGDAKIDASDNVGGQVVAGMLIGQGVASQPVLVDMTNFSMTLFNRQSDLDYSPPPPPTGPGVSGGHFDPDFYALEGTTYSKIKHVHEYDDKFDVTGVNMLNASDPGLNIPSKLAANVDFKVLVINQYLNPAMTVKVGNAGYVNVKTYGGQAAAADPAAMLAAQPTYNLGNIGSLIWNLPVDAFQTRDWWGDGTAGRVGLMPTKTGCVNGMNADGSPSDPGPNGEHRNGAFTVQLVRANTPAAALELNYPAGGPKYGWRVKYAEFKTYVLAEHTAFWHHPNGKCYGEVGWVQNAPQDFSGGGKASAGAAGSADPKYGSFGGTPPPAGVTIVSTTTTVNGNVTLITVTYSDGKKQTTEITNNGNGTETVTVTARDGSVSSENRMSSGSIGSAPNEILQPSRRINWREVIRP